MPDTPRHHLSRIAGAALLALPLLAAAGPPATAEDAAQDAVATCLSCAGGGADGAALAAACFSCHGPEGRGSGTIPALAGEDEGELAQALTAYAAGEREGTIMPRLAPSYSSEEIAALAAWFAGVTP